MSTGACIKVIQIKELWKLRVFLVAFWPLCNQSITEVGRVPFSGGKALRTATFQTYLHMWADIRNAPVTSANNCVLFELVTQIVLLKIYFMPIYILRCRETFENKILMHRNKSSIYSSEGRIDNELAFLYYLKSVLMEVDVIVLKRR